LKKFIGFRKIFVENYHKIFSYTILQNFKVKHTEVNMSLKSKIIEKDCLTNEDILQMFQLMERHYENLNYDNFIKDLNEKDYCIVIYTEEDNKIRGFSTQKLLSFKNGTSNINGVFSGDTVIDKEYWGSLELYKCFAQFFVKPGEGDDRFYWFLTSKGYKTYKILPLFFENFYPDYRTDTPTEVKSIMNRFGEIKYPDDYDKEKGVIVYKGTRDRLKSGIADIEEKHIKDPDIKFFLEKNPGFKDGDDLVCLTELKMSNLKRIAKRLLFEK